MTDYVVDASVVVQRLIQDGLIHNLAVYDSVYIALAEHMSRPLITVDARQERAAIATGIVVKSLTDF
jgi:predicted nucleic acid-binding protein